MNYKKVLAAVAASMMLTGCGIYSKYENKTQTPDNVFGTSMLDETVTEANANSIAQLSWRESFSDPLLKQLIEQVLANNTDLNSARIAVE